MFLGAMGLPGGGRSDLCPRFMRHTNIIGVDVFTDETLTRIFTTIADWHFTKGFDKTVALWRGVSFPQSKISHFVILIG